MKGAASKKIFMKIIQLSRDADSNFGSADQSSSGNSNASLDNPSSMLPGKIDTLVLLDREVDLISTLISPLTYEGLLDEIVGIENGRYRIYTSFMQKFF